MLWNEDLFHLITTESIKLRRDGFMIIGLGDFNSKIGQVNGLEGNNPDRNTNAPLFLNFIQEANLFIMNTLPIAKEK